MFVTHDLEEAIALADQVVVMTAGPGTVKAVFDIDLPRPRGAVQEIRFGKRFGELHHEIWESLRDEVDAGVRAHRRVGRGWRRRRPAGERGGTVMTTPRKLWVHLARLAVLIIMFGGWQLLTR